MPSGAAVREAGVRVDDIVGAGRAVAEVLRSASEQVQCKRSADVLTRRADSCVLSVMMRWENLGVKLVSMDLPSVLPSGQTQCLPSWHALL